MFCGCFVWLFYCFYSFVLFLYITDDVVLITQHFTFSMLTEWNGKSEVVTIITIIAFSIVFSMWACSPCVCRLIVLWNLKSDLWLLPSWDSGARRGMQRVECLGDYSRAWFSNTWPPLTKAYPVLSFHGSLTLQWKQDRKLGNWVVFQWFNYIFSHSITGWKELWSPASCPEFKHATLLPLLIKRRLHRSPRGRQPVSNQRLNYL